MSLNKDNFNFAIESDILQIVNTEQAWHYKIVPFKLGLNNIDFYISDRNNLTALKKELNIVFNKYIEFTIISEDNLAKLLSLYYRNANVNNVKKNDYIENNDFLEKIINEAFLLKASDIHFECFEESARIRYRIDGNLIEKHYLSPEDYPSIVNKIKIKSNLDISEKRLPQDGRIFFEDNNIKFDIRVSILPSLFGEKIVLRILSKDLSNISLDYLGMNNEQLFTFKESLKKTNGIVLISGPTGSGKTTTLYASLKFLNNKKSNILTIEDPIEYTLEGVTQSQLKENIGFSFSNALKTFLRQDPDIIMVGEIRDKETAEMAIRAALTGHLVLSTIHTNSAWGIISRLIDMNVPSYLLSNTINLAVSQRLLKTLCPHCKEEINIDIKDFPINYSFPYEISKISKAVGCNKCYFTGYMGRKAIYEMIPINQEISLMIKNNTNINKEFYHQNNIKSISDCAFEMLANNETSIEEVYPLLMNTRFD